jgi:hypothetical protein
MGMAPGQATVPALVVAVGLAPVWYAVRVLVGLPGFGLLVNAVSWLQGFGPLRPWLDGVGLTLIQPAIMVAAVVEALIPAYRAGWVSVADVLRHE